MEVTARWEGGYRCTMRIRQFQLRVDEPPASGGTDTGMQPTEVLLASVASCFTLAIAHVAMKTGAALAEMSVTATGDYEGPRFRRIIVRVDSAHPVDDLVDLARRAIRVCYVSNTLRGGPEIEYLVGDMSIHRQPPSPVEAAPLPTP
jgi:putative redox protein